MTRHMKALVKSEARARASGWRTSRSPSVGPNDVLIRVSKTAICGTDMHIYNWDAWAQKTIPVPMARRPRVHAARSSRSAAKCAASSVGDRVSGEGPHHLRLLPQLPRRPAAPVPQHRGRRRESPGLLRRVPRRSRRSTRSSCPTRSPTTSPRSSIRSATPRTPRSSFDLVGEDVLITGAGPIGIMAAAIARTSARATSSSPTSTTTGSSSRARWARRRAVNVDAREARRRR